MRTSQENEKSVIAEYTDMETPGERKQPRTSKMTRQQRTTKSLQGNSTNVESLRCSHNVINSVACYLDDPMAEFAFQNKEKQRHRLELIRVHDQRQNTVLEAAACSGSNS